MKLKTLALVVAVLAVASAVVFYANRPAPRASDDPRVGKPLLDPATADTVGAVSVESGGTSAVLARQGDGTWRVTNYHDFPADMAKLATLVGDLTAAKVEQYVTGRPEKLARLEFKDTRIQLGATSPGDLLSLTLGRNADAGGRFVRFGDEQKGYRAGLNAFLDAEPKNWVQSSLVPLKADEIGRVELRFPEASPVVATRAKKEDAFVAQDAPEGRQLDTGKISALLSSLTSLRFTETAEPGDARAQEARAHARVAVLTTFDGKTVTVSLGRKPEEKRIKPPAPKTDGSTGPAALGSVADLNQPTPAASANGETSKPELLAPEMETIPAGPVYATVHHSDTDAPINAMMGKRAFEVYEWAFSSFPATRDDVFIAKPAEVPPAPTAVPPAGETAAAPATSDAPAKDAPADIK